MGKWMHHVAGIGATVLCSCNLLLAQSSFDATYDLGDDNSQFNYPSVPDGDGGYRVFRFKYYAAGPEAAITAVHLSSEGTVLDAAYYAESAIGVPDRAILLLDTTTLILAGASILHLGRAGDVLSYTTIPTTGTSDYTHFAVKDGRVYVVVNTVDMDPYQRTLTVLKMDLDGTIVQQRSFRNDSAQIRIEAIEGVDGAGLVLAGRAFGIPSKLVVLAMDTTLATNWVFSGPMISYGSNVPVMVRALSDSACAVIWDPHLPEEPGGLLVLGPSGNIIDYHTHTMDNVGDAKFLSDGGWLFLQSPGPYPALIRHFNPDGNLVGGGTISGLYLGKIWRDTVPGWWFALSGTFDGDMSMARFNLADGTCLAPPTWVVSMTSDTAQLQPLALNEVPFPLAAVPGTCTRHPLAVTRAVHCGTVGVEEIIVPLLSTCTQVLGTDAEIAVKVQWDEADMPTVKLIDAVGRTLPSVSAQWVPTGDGTRLLRFQRPPASGMAILQLVGKQRMVGCKLLLGME